MPGRMALWSSAKPRVALPLRADNRLARKKNEATEIHVINGSPLVWRVRLLCQGKRSRAECDTLKSTIVDQEKALPRSLVAWDDGRRRVSNVLRRCSISKGGKKKALLKGVVMLIFILFFFLNKCSFQLGDMPLAESEVLWNEMGAKRLCWKRSFVIIFFFLKDETETNHFKTFRPLMWRVNC